jgi:hypothetical protein
MSDKELSVEDMKRVKNCEYYLLTKAIMGAYEEYQNTNVGEVYFVKSVRSDGSSYYISTYGSSDRDKYMVVYKDGGFIFVKRICASGKLGKEIQCLTTQYPPSDGYILEPDPDYVDSILFEKEGDYDPMAAAKELNKKKNRARRANKKIQVPKFETASEAKDYIDSITNKTILWDAATTFGTGIVEWHVTNIEKRATDQTVANQSHWYSRQKYPGNTPDDQKHNQHGLKQFTKITITAQNKPSDRWFYGTMELTFDDFMKSGYRTLYTQKPVTTDDV